MSRIEMYLVTASLGSMLGVLLAYVNAPVPVVLLTALIGGGYAWYAYRRFVR